MVGRTRLAARSVSEYRGSISEGAGEEELW